MGVCKLLNRLENFDPIEAPVFFIQFAFEFVLIWIKLQFNLTVLGTRPFRPL